MDYDRIERHVLMVISQAHQCLEMLQKLREKYSLHDDVDHVKAAHPKSLVVRTNTEIPSVDPLFQNSQVVAELSRDVNLRQRRARTTSFFRKVNFTWSLKDDTNDRDRVMIHIQTLKSCNDALRECLSPPQRQSTDKLVNMKILALSASPADLKGIGNAASATQDQLHGQIYQAIMIKARRAEESSHSVTDKELKQIEMESWMFDFASNDAGASPGMSMRVLAQHKRFGGLSVCKQN